MEFLEITIYKIILRTYFFLEETGRKNSFDRFPYLDVLTQRLTPETEAAWQNDDGIPSRRYHRLLGKLAGAQGRSSLIPGMASQVSPADSKGSSSPTSGMASQLSSAGSQGSLPYVLATALDLSLAALHVPEFAGYLNYYTGNHVTIQLAYDLEGIPYPGYERMADSLRRLRLICRVDCTGKPACHAAIEADDRLFAYLTGSDALTPPLCGQAEWCSPEETLHPLYIRHELRDQCARLLTEGTNGSQIVQIAGAGGRRFLARHAARSLSLGLLLTDARHFKGCCEGETAISPAELIREAFLRESAVCIYGIDSALFQTAQIDSATFYQTVILPFRDAGIPLFLCTEQNFRFPEPVPCVELTESTQKEREEVFRSFAAAAGIPADCVSFLARFRLSPSQIAEAAAIWRSPESDRCKALEKNTQESKRDQTEQTRQIFSRICCEILCRGQQGSAGTLLYPSVGFSDLKVPEKTLQILHEICCSVAERERLCEEWNFRQLYPYGRATSVLLTGPPGTGKTMTAHVIARELCLPLYQVNLACVADKYIGETEKHLEEIFSFAEKADVVLFFDEADSLFGKRGEVTEGKDRYANMEVSYILQRMEQFDGIVILATNFYHNIDKAFLRRLKYVLRYQIPDETLRRGIWESCLPRTAPHGGLDIPYLAKQFEFTGGVIKNVVWNACVKAVCAGTQLTMEQILTAIAEEYEKMEQTVGNNVWGEYRYLLP